MESSGNRTGFLAVILSLAVIALIYITIPCYSFFSDGIQFAIEIRYSSDWILHANHVLYPLLPQAIYSLIGGPATGMGVLDFLVAWSNVAGIAAAVFMVLIFRACSMKSPAVVIGLALFAFTNGVWYFAVTPNQNSTPLLLNVLTLYVMILITNRGDRPNFREILLTSVMLVVSILSSQVNAALILPAIWIFSQGDESRRIDIRRAITVVLVTAIMLFLAVAAIGIFAGGFRTVADFIAWQHSYVFQSRWWPDSFGDAFERNLIGLLTVHIANLFPADGWWNNWLLRLGQIYVIAFILFEFVIATLRYFRNVEKTPVQTIGLLAAVPVFVFSFFFIPENLNLRVLYIPGFLIFLMPSIAKRYSLDRFSLKAWPVFLAAAALLLVNLTTEYLPASNPSSNPRLVEAGELMQYVDPDDMIVYPWTDEGHTMSLYVQYFLGCDSLTVNKLIDLEKAGAVIGLIELLTGDDADRTVWIDGDILESDAVMQGMMERYDREYDQDEIDDFIARWLTPSEKEFTTADYCYLGYEGAQLWD